MKRKKQRKSITLTPRMQMAAAIAVPLALAVAGWFLVIAPQRQKAADLAAQTEAVRTEIAQARAALVNDLKPDPIRVADVFHLTRAMPDQEDMPGIILQLSSVARESGITFKSITPGGQSTQSGYTVKQIGLTFTGSFYGLSDFLYRLRSLVDVRAGQLDADGRLFTVDSLSFSQGEKGFPQIDATLTVNAFIYGVAAPAAPVTPTVPAPTGTESTPTTTSTTTTTPSGSVASGAATQGVSS